MNAGNTIAALGAVFFLATAASQPASGASPAPAVGVVVETAAPADTTAHELNAADVGAWLNGLLTYGLESGDVAGAEVAVVKDGKVLFQSGYGYADVERKT